jgi:FkbM family methyltransferase
MQSLRHLVKAHPRAYDAVRRCRRAFSMKDEAYVYLDAFSRQYGRDVTFVQIGANDGLRNDPVREFVVRDRWRGILVEPLPNAFRLLKKNYAYLSDRRLTFVNAAISAKDGQLIFYTLSDEYLQSLNSEVALDCMRKSSFDRRHVERFIAGKHPDAAIVGLPVPCLTFSNLLDTYGRYLGVIDLVVIDAEGHEPEIFAAMDFTIYRPSVIFFESSNLGERSDQILNRLAANRYEVHELGGDAIAVQRDTRHGMFNLPCWKRSDENPDAE